MTQARIVVRPHPSYVAGTADPYHFLYRIEIENLGPGTVQLLHRRWLITDANGKMLEVEGPGVVGEQPCIAPGEAHRYSSGAVIETPVGVMQGRYGMITGDGVRFPAPIPAFRLAVPGILH